MKKLFVSETSGAELENERFALNTSLINSDDEARAEIARTAAETGLPCGDPYRFGADELWADVEAGVEALPWV